MPPMEGAWPIPTPYVSKQANPPRARALAALAERQHGVVSLAQLQALGLGPSAVRNRVARGVLHRVHQGVYAVGHPLLSARGRWMAAVLACGPGAVLSHRSAAMLWGLHEAATAQVDVTSPGRAGRGRRGIAAHSAATLDRRDVTAVDRIPCTTVARTLLDLAELLDRPGLERACERAERLGLFDGRAVEEVLARATGRSGSAALAAVLEAWRPEVLRTRSELERRFLGLCSAADVPRPEPNAWIPLPGGGAIEVDFLWRGAGLVVETDGHCFHGTRRAFEDDRRRDQRLLVAGFTVARFTWRQVLERPREVAATVRRLLRDRVEA
jgi:hypothetical protein